MVIDAWSRRVVGWAMETHLRTELVLEALNMATNQRRPTGVILRRVTPQCRWRPRLETLAALSCRSPRRPPTSTTASSNEVNAKVYGPRRDSLGVAATRAGAAAHTVDGHITESPTFLPPIPHRAIPPSTMWTAASAITRRQNHALQRTISTPGNQKIRKDRVIPKSLTVYENGVGPQGTGGRARPLSRSRTTAIWRPSSSPIILG